MSKDLIIGYGNVDRQDDGVAWHVLVSLSEKIGRSAPYSPEEDFPTATYSPQFIFIMQLIPELAETVSRYDRVCFVDAHTGNFPEEVFVSDILGEYQNSPFTHHMTPATILSLTHTLYNATPRAILVSIRGYEYEFTRVLSSTTSANVSVAVEKIIAWLHEGDK